METLTHARYDDCAKKEISVLRKPRQRQGRKVGECY